MFVVVWQKQDVEFTLKDRNKNIVLCGGEINIVRRRQKHSVVTRSKQLFLGFV